MVIQCPACQTKYKLEESKFEGKASKKIKCPKCTHIFEAKNPSAEAPVSAPTRAPMAVPPPLPPPQVEETTDMRDARENVFSQMADGILELPQDKKLSLAIIQGPTQGKIFQIDKPRMTIGRASADIVLSDQEVSRQHSAIEVFQDRVIVRDLTSTNGTFVDGVRVKLHPLDNHAEFRVGNTTLMLIVTGISDEDIL